jgi:tRNA(adenine34) deaminase
VHVDLDAAWWRALSLAWQSYCAGSTPVGALVLAPDGTVAGEGRAQRFEARARDGQLAHTHIAHAEINALAMLPPTRHYEDHLLVTTLEPCCMCLGATVQATITRLHYAAPDAYAGSSHLVIDTPQARRRPLRVHGPLDDHRGRFAELLHLVWLLDMPAAPAVLQAHRTHRSDSYQAAARIQARLNTFKNEQAPLAAAVEATSSS